MNILETGILETGLVFVMFCVAVFVSAWVDRSEDGGGY